MRRHSPLTVARIALLVSALAYAATLKLGAYFSIAVLLNYIAFAAMAASALACVFFQIFRLPRRRGYPRGYRDGGRPLP